MLSNTLTAGAWLGVGDTSTAFDASQTDLQASTNKVRKVVDSGFPTLSTNILTLQSTFATTEANFHWQEWGVFNASTGSVMVNRKVEDLGTKTNTQSWQLTVTLTLVSS